MSVDNQAHRIRGDAGDVGAKLASVTRSRARVDHQGSPVTEDEADLLIEEPIPTGEDPVSDLQPIRRIAHVSDGTRGAAAAVCAEYAPAMPSTTDSATTRDGIRLLIRHWAAEAPRAAVLLVHGLGEHSGRYEHVGEQLSAARLETFAWDLRGHGASGGERAWVDSWARFHDDLEDRLSAVRATVPGLPVVIYGHSLGGLIALGYYVDGRPPPDLMVLSAPGLDDDLAAWKHKLAPMLARIAPHLRIANGINPPHRSRDAARQEEVRVDPLMVYATTSRMGALGFAEQPRVRAAATRLTVPTLVIHGLDDPIVPARASEPLASLPGVTRRAYAGIRHEPHNEPEGPQIIADVIAWIDSQLEEPPGASQGPSEEGV